MGICNDCDEQLCDVCTSMKRHPAGNAVVTDFTWALATAKRLGAELEQERIIKLLETQPVVNAKDYSDEDIWAFQKAIALIKGENK